MREFFVKDKEENQRLDKYLRKNMDDVALSSIYKIFRKKDVKVNGIREKEDYLVKVNDKIIVYVEEKKHNDHQEIKKYQKEFDVIYEDNNILIVNKPIGLEVQDDGKNNLTSQVLTYLNSKNEYFYEDNFKPSPAHRLDRNTSGLVVFGKSVKVLQELNECFKNRIGIEKYYLALVLGKTKEKETLSFPLLKNEKSKIVKVDFEKGLTAKTKYQLVWTNNNYSLLEVQLMTGRTHQIRVHLSYIGHPLIGDEKYGDFKENKLFYNQFKYRYQFLHAYKMCFTNLNGVLKYLNNRNFMAPLTSDKITILKALGYKNSI
ncbi:MAG: RluA family pseudouridine synthase [Bacilli bacterium]|nr:RluA family pseudouridine synthase [Bacilli bacterium]